MIRWPISWKYGDRIFVVGPSGCGKTTVLKSLLKQRGNVVLIDTKHSDEDGFDEVGEVIKGGDLRRIREGRFVWQADRGFILDPDQQSRFWFAALESGPRAFGMDEAYNLLRTPGEKLFMTQCRGKKVAFILGAQRPSGLSLHIVFNCNYYIIFFLPSEDDRDRMEKATGHKDIPWEKLQREEHSFIIYNERGDVGGPYRLKL